MLDTARPLDGRVALATGGATGLLLPGYSVYDATRAALEQLTRIGVDRLGQVRGSSHAAATSARP